MAVVHESRLSAHRPIPDVRGWDDLDPLGPIVATPVGVPWTLIQKAYMRGDDYTS